MKAFTFRLFGYEIFSFDLIDEVWDEPEELELPNRYVYYCTHCEEELVSSLYPLDEEDQSILRIEHKENCTADWE